MESFVEAGKENLLASNIKNAGTPIKFDSVYLAYYPVTMEDGSHEMLPVWAVEAQVNNHTVVARVIINAIDGSYITTIYN